MFGTAGSIPCGNGIGKAHMSRFRKPSASVDEEKFRRFRFETFRPFSIRLGFFLVILFFLTFIPDGILDTAKALRWLPLRIFVGITMTAYPISLIWDVNKKILPWLLYGTVLVGMVIRIASELPINSTSVDNIWMAFYFLFASFILGLPLKRRENVLGLLTIVMIPNLFGLFNKNLIHSIMRFDLMVIPLCVFLIYIQHHINRLLKYLYSYQEQIKSMANRDALTGLFNRRHFEEAADLMAKRARRAHLNLCMIMIDIDHFKSINDRFGHPVGDMVIKETAKTLAGAFRETDLVARLGGEEFVALLSEQNPLAGEHAAERARKSIENSEIKLPGLSESIKFTASFGLAVMKSEGETIAELLERTDQGLYAAKRAGRNRVVHQKPENTNENPDNH